MLSSLLLLASIGGQAAAFCVIYQSISRKKISFRAFLLLFLISSVIIPLISYFSCIFLFLFFYLYGFNNNQKENKNLLWFYSIYTTLVTSLLGYLFTSASFSLLSIFSLETDFTEHLITLSAPIFPILVNYLLLKLIKPNLDFLRKHSADLNNIFLTAINVILTVCCIIQYTHYWFENYIGPTRVKGYLLLIFTGTVIALLSYLNIKTREMNNQQLQQLKDEQVSDLTAYVDHIENLYENLRGFRHDYQNVLISLKESINTQDLAVIEETYQSILENEKIDLQDNKFHLTKLNNIKLLPVKGIVSAKLIRALQENITVSIEVNDPVSETSLDILDYVRILSILLDNAIEAALTSVKPTVNLAFFLNEDKTEQIILIENTCPDEPINLSQIFIPGYSTKGTNRGIGLANLKKILTQYNQLALETEYTDHLFRQIITIKGGNNE